MMMGLTRRILLLDDDANFRRLMMPLLQAQGVEIIQAATGEEAKANMQHNNFDLLIVDGDLPDTDGMQWLTEIRADNINTETIFVSGAWRDTTSYCRLVEELDVRVILHKPLAPRVFVEQVMQVLRNAKAINVPLFQIEAEEELRLLAVDYVNHLPPEIANLRRHITKAEFQSDCIALREGMQIAHRLRGTAGSYGMELVGLLMGEVEDTLRKIKEKNGNAAIATYRRLHALADRAYREAKRHQMTARLATRKKEMSAFERSKITAGNSRRILLVDDDRFFMARMEQLLTPLSVRLTSFTDSIFLEEVLDELQPSMLILDLNLPGPSGFDLCRRIKSSVRWKNLPILIVSADCSPETVAAALACGADDFIAKPLNNTECLDKVRKLFISNENKQLKRVERKVELCSNR